MNVEQINICQALSYKLISLTPNLYNKPDLRCWCCPCVCFTETETGSGWEWYLLKSNLKDRGQAGAFLFTSAPGFGSILSWAPRGPDIPSCVLPFLTPTHFLFLLPLC